MPERRGAAIGAAAGNNVDQAQQARVQTINDANARAVDAATHPALSLDQIGEMARNRVSDTIIINLINSTGSTYLLNWQQVSWLRDQGVSNFVIEYMQSRAPYVAEPGVPVVVSGAVPVGVGVGVGIGVRR